MGAGMLKKWGFLKEDGRNSSERADKEVVWFKRWSLELVSKLCRTWLHPRVLNPDIYK